MGHLGHFHEQDCSVVASAVIRFLELDIGPVEDHSAN